MTELQEQLVALIDRIEEVLKTEQSEDLFSSSHGISFQQQYEELLSFMGVSTIIPATFSLVQPMSQYFSDPMKLKDLISEILAFALRQAQLPSAQRQLAQECATQIEAQIEKMITFGLEEFQTLNSLSDEFNRILGTTEGTEKTQDEDIVEVSEVSQLFHSIQYIKRTNASFIFSLYTLIDYYTKGLIIDVISKTPQDQVYEDAKGFEDAKNNPQKAVSWSLKQLDKRYPHSKQVLGSVMTKKGWIKHRSAFQSLSEVRHPIAHEQPIVSLTALQETFPQYQDEVRQKLTDIKEGMKLQQLPPTIRDSLDVLIQEFETYFFLQAIGHGCFRYLTIIDRLAQICLIDPKDIGESLK